MDLLDHGVDPVSGNAFLIALAVSLVGIAGAVVGYWLWRRAEARRLVSDP